MKMLIVLLLSSLSFGAANVHAVAVPGTCGWHVEIYSPTGLTVPNQCLKGYIGVHIVKNGKTIAPQTRAECEEACRTQYKNLPTYVAPRAEIKSIDDGVG